MDISDLASADIVLTTYDVLKEDLSHDSDRHEGDRHFLRFQKRFALKAAIFPLCYYIICRIFYLYISRRVYEFGRAFHPSVLTVYLRCYILFMISNL